MELDFDVVSLPAADHPTVGETAPDFTRPLVSEEYWSDVALSSLDTPVLLVFYPMNGSFPATYLWAELRDRELDEIATVVGITISTPYAHTQFIRDHDLAETDIRLFADPQNEVASEYDLVNDLDGMTGLSEPRPAVFLIEEDRTIDYAWVAAKWPEFPNYDTLETAVRDAAKR